MKQVWPAAIIAFILLCIAGILCIEWTANPSVYVPNPVMPNPNAFDKYVAAEKTLKDSKIANDLETKMNKGALATSDLALARHVIQENALTVSLVHEGMQLPYQSPRVRSIDTTMPYYSGFRAIARLMLLRGMVAANDGDYGASMNINLDVIQYGSTISQGSALIGDLVGLSCQAIGRRKTWQLIDHLNASESRAAAHRMESIAHNQFPYFRTLQEEKWSSQASLAEYLRRPEFRYPNFATFPSKRIIMARFENFMNKEIENAQKTYDPGWKDPVRPRDVMNSAFLPEFEKVRIKDHNNVSQNALLIVTFALHSYKLENGSYPDTLSQLVPAYLSKIPADPFALSGPLCYKRTSDNYVLYSVGPDGKDDGGKPIFDAAKGGGSLSRASSYYIDEHSTGDIVAGVNIY